MQMVKGTKIGENIGRIAIWIGLNNAWIADWNKNCNPDFWARDSDLA